MEETKIKAYQKIVDEIYDRNKNDINNFSLSDKLVLKNIFQDLKKDTIKYLKAINYWANMDLSSEICDAKSADIRKLKYLIGKPLNGNENFKY